MPRAYGTQPLPITHDPRNVAQANFDRARQGATEKALQMAGEAFGKFLQEMLAKTGLDLRNAAALVASLGDLVVHGAEQVIDQLLAATGIDLSSWGRLFDGVHEQTGTDLRGLAGVVEGIPATVEQVANDVVAGVNRAVEEVARDAAAVGATLAETIANVLGVAHDANASARQAVADLAAVSPGEATAPLWLGAGSDDLVVFPRSMLGMSFWPQTELADGSGGQHAHRLTPLPVSVSPASGVASLLFVRADRALPVGRVKLVTANKTSWAALGGAPSSFVVGLYALDLGAGVLKLVWSSGNVASQVSSAAREYAFPTGQALGVRPGHVLAVGVLQTAGLFASPRPLMGKADTDVAWSDGAPPGMYGTYRASAFGDSQLASQIPLSKVSFDYTQSVYAALAR